jgi:hypothetical protein
VLHTILKEAKRAATKVNQHANSVALLVAACRIVVLLAVAPEGSTPSMNEPAIGAVSTAVQPCGIKVGPADANHE